MTYDQIHFPNHIRALTWKRLGHSFICTVCCHLSKVPSSCTSPVCDFCSSPQPAPSPMEQTCNCLRTQQSALSMPGRHRLSDVTIGQCLKEKIRQDFPRCLSVARSRNHLFTSVMLMESSETLPEKSISTRLCLPSTVSLPLSQHPTQPKAPCRELDKPLEAQ